MTTASEVPVADVAAPVPLGEIERELSRRMKLLQGSGDAPVLWARRVAAPRASWPSPSWRFSSASTWLTGTATPPPMSAAFITASSTRGRRSR